MYIFFLLNLNLRFLCFFCCLFWTQKCKKKLFDKKSSCLVKSTPPPEYAPGHIATRHHIGSSKMGLLKEFVLLEVSFGEGEGRGVFQLHSMFMSNAVYYTWIIQCIYNSCMIQVNQECPLSSGGCYLFCWVEWFFILQLLRIYILYNIGLESM